MCASRAHSRSSASAEFVIGEAAIAKIRAGACLIQLYSALVFHGLRIVATIKSELSNALRRENQPTINELVGVDAAAMTAERWPP